MKENASVVVFPSLFAKNRINLLISNVKKILKIKNQAYQKISKDDQIIIVEANDPVFASSAIGLLFGVDKIAIAKKERNDFDSIVSAITKIGSNLLLKGDSYLVKVEGFTKGFLTKDVEIAATSSLIEKTKDLGVKPGTEQNHNKVLYTFLTKSNAYVCIFWDKGLGGIPYFSQDEKTICIVFDGLSALICLETIKQGFDTKLVVCFQKSSDLLKIVKMVNRILPRMLTQKIEIEFYKIPISPGSKNLESIIKILTELLIIIAKNNNIKKISLPVSPLIFPSSVINELTSMVNSEKLYTHISLSGLDDDILNTAKEIGLAKFLPEIQKYAKIKFNKKSNTPPNLSKILKTILQSQKKVAVTIGPNNIHDILDSLETNK